MISRKLLLFCILVLYGGENTYANKNSDCMLFRSCPEAIRFVGNGNDMEKNKKLNSSFCGIENVDGAKLPKIFCSLFRTNDERSAFFDESPTDSIETHPNVNLLPKNCGRLYSDRIIFGTIANLYEFPWMALIAYWTRNAPGSENNLKFQCGGSIINSKYILTAAHCVVGKNLAGVRIGEFNINSEEDCQGEDRNIICERHLQDILIEEVIPHENFTHFPYQNDIALLRLKKPIDFSYKNAAPICLPVSKILRDAVLGGKRATVAGWGTTEDGTESSMLRKVDVPVLTATACSDLYNKYSKTDTTINKICAGELNKDSCNGDSGGPLMLGEEVDDEYRVIQYGVVSYGPLQCGSLFPAVYTNVASYVKWILDHVKP